MSKVKIDTRVEPETEQKLLKKAKQERRNKSEMIRVIIEDAVKDVKLI